MNMKKEKIITQERYEQSYQIMMHLCNVVKPITFDKIKDDLYEYLLYEDIDLNIEPLKIYKLYNKK